MHIWFYFILFWFYYQFIMDLWDPWKQSLWDQHGAHLGPTGPRWAPCWPHESIWDVSTHIISLRPRQKCRHFADNIFKGIFLNEDMFEYQLKFHCIFSLGSNQWYANIGSDNGLAPIRRQTIIWTNDGLVCWRIYASLSLNVLKGNTYTYIHIHMFNIIIFGHSN